MRGDPHPYDLCEVAPLPLPTHCRPGTRGKRRVLRRRVERGEQLFHPEDAVGDVELLAFFALSWTSRRLPSENLASRAQEFVTSRVQP
jgi:hypothetical protein